jgi:protein tyrosine phosphatase
MAAGGANPYRDPSDSKGGPLIPSRVVTGPVETQTPRTQRRDGFRSAFGATARTTSTIDAQDIVQRIDEMKQRGMIDAEFAQIKADSAAFAATFSAAAEQYNVKKNRYMNVRPIDATRVKLSHSGALGGDYINANYVTGWHSDPAYICTQGPIPNTIHDFWRMVWEENVGVIAMVTKEVEKGRLKCHKYWPDENGSIQCGTLEVLYREYDDSDPDVTVRKITLRSSIFNESREVVQMQMKSWPDQGVPRTAAAFLQLMHSLRSFHAEASARGQGGPIVVHCSAGIGRTGTLIAVDISLRRLLAMGNVDLLSTVNHMRQQRAGSVQTIAQYRFCYDAIREYVVLNGVQAVEAPVAELPAQLSPEELNELMKLAQPDTGDDDMALLQKLQVLVQS